MLPSDALMYVSMMSLYAVKPVLTGAVIPINNK